MFIAFGNNGPHWGCYSKVPNVLQCNGVLYESFNISEH